MKLIEKLENHSEFLNIGAIVSYFTLCSFAFYQGGIGIIELLYALLFFISLKFLFKKGSLFSLCITVFSLTTLVFYNFLPLGISFIIGYLSLIVTFILTSRKSVTIEMSETEVFFQSIIFLLFSYQIYDGIKVEFIILVVIYLVQLFYKFKGKKINNPLAIPSIMLMVVFFHTFYQLYINFGILGNSIVLFLSFYLPRYIAILSLGKRSEVMPYKLNLESVNQQKTKMLIYTLTSLFVALISILSNLDTFSLFLNLLLFSPFISELMYWFWFTYIKKTSYY